MFEDLRSELRYCTGSELGSELTFLAGSELRTSELDTSESKTSEYRFLKIFMLASYEQELCPERPRVYSDLSPKDKERYNADIRATNILLQGFPKDIYSLINHYTDAKDMWDNVKMLLEGSELTKEDRESQLYNDFEHFRQHKGETIHDYYVWVFKIEERGTMHGVQVQLVMGEHRTELGMLNIHITPNTLKTNVADAKLKRTVVAWMKSSIFIAGGQGHAIDEDVDEQPVQDLALNMNNVFQADDCDAFDYDVDEAPTAQTMFMANLSSVYPDAVCEHHKEHEMHDDVQPNYVVDLHANYTSDSNMIPYDQYVKDNAVPVVPKRTGFELTEREQKIDEQLRIVITDRNIKEENLKKEFHSVKMQLASTNQPNKSMVEEVTL
ncbi:hypothetical protein Tco_0629625 [Tanacetum coccineum]|uniref:Integrase, catalytic region, zinc finger, CCHC-type, peptidase aspartic, catalytic n=1 Tax=Tanacetum coccineum TaxID=301880 RepID=A0ABQ4WTS9_9ASTR